MRLTHTCSMKKNFIVISILLFNICCSAQKTFLAGVYDIPIDVTCEEFQQNITRESQYLGEYNIASFEESPHIYDEKADTYLVDDVWGHGRAHVYVLCKEERVKQVYMEFPWGDASQLGSEPMAVFTWGAGHVFPELYGSPSDEGNGWEEINHTTRHYWLKSWYRPDGIKVTIKVWHRWPGSPFREQDHFSIKGSEARTEIFYEVL